MTGDRRRLLVVTLGGVLLLAVVGALVASSPGEPPAPTPSDPGAPTSPEPSPPQQRASPSPAPSPSPPEAGGLLVMWSREGLPSEVAASAADLPGVAAVAFVRSDTLGVVGARDASGAPVERFEPGMRVPVAVTAVDPEAWLAIVGAPTTGEPDIGDLVPGTVVLSRTGADLRGVGVGGRIDLPGLADLEVVAVVPDDRLRRAEMMLHPDDARSAGLRSEGSLVVRHTRPPGDGRDALLSALEALAPGDVRSQVVGGELAGYRAPLVLSLPEVKRRFGEFAYRPRPGERSIDIAPGFVDDHIVDAAVPVLGTVRCHRDIIGDLRAALQEIVDAGLGDAIDPDTYAGCFNARRISPDRERLSRHSWGIALDINVDLSLPGLGEPPPEEVVAVFGRHGFRWGGDFLHPDNHHFEWVGAGADERPPPRP